MARFAEYHKIETLFERDMDNFVVDHANLKASVLGLSANVTLPKK